MLFSNRAACGRASGVGRGGGGGAHGGGLFRAEDTSLHPLYSAFNQTIQLYILH
jgi:hypothetical protein